MPKPDGLGAAPMGNVKPVDPAERRRDQPTDNPCGNYPIRDSRRDWTLHYDVNNIKDDGSRKEP